MKQRAAMEQPPGFASMWQNPKFQDMVIRLTAVPQPADATPKKADEGAEPPAKRLKDTPEVIEDIHVNKTLLASSSNYWMARIERWDEQADAASVKDQTGKVLAVFEEPLGPDDLPVARAAVQFTYTHQPPSGTVLLLQAVRLADKWAMPGYMTTCLDKLAKVAVAALTAQDINLIMANDLPPGVLQHPSYAAVKQTCSKALMRLFAKPQQLYNSEDERKLTDFRGLSFAALLLWAQQDELQVDSENTVVMLITDWWQRNMPKARVHGLSDQARLQCKEQLSSALRVQHLTASFFADMLRKLDWFTLAHAPDALSTVKLIKQLNIKRQDSWNTIIPSDWLKGPRTSADQEFTYEWEVTKAQLQQLHADARDGSKAVWAPGPFFWKGVWWQHGLRLESQSSALDITLQTWRKAPLIGPLAVSVTCDLKVVDVDKRTLSTWELFWWLEHKHAYIVDNKSLGVPATSAPRPSSLPPARLMPDGKLRLQVVMKALDEPLIDDETTTAA